MPAADARSPFPPHRAAAHSSRHQHGECRHPPEPNHIPNGCGTGDFAFSGYAIVDPAKELGDGQVSLRLAGDGNRANIICGIRQDILAGQ